MKIDDIDKLYIFKRDGKQCYFCKKPLEIDQITLDHYLPKSRKGTMDVFNLVVCCKKCNKLKGNRIPDNYLDTILELFMKAVHDNKIKGCNLKMKQKQLNEELVKIYKIEAITDHFIFQSNEKRFYVKNNRVFKLIYVNTSINEIE